MSFYDRFGKRALDLALSGLGFAVTLPAHLAISAAVYVSSGRPIYFTQERAGRDGQPFSLIKFRTMTVGTHEISGGYPSADMITPVGRVLRNTSLDELPQLLNILKGDMSIVGPRPALLEQASRYNLGQRDRLRVRPGLTGLAQIRYRNSAPWSVRIQTDLEYISNVRLWTDVKIIAATVPSVLRGSSVIIGQTALDVDDLDPRPIPPEPGSS